MKKHNVILADSNIAPFRDPWELQWFMTGKEEHCNKEVRALLSKPQCPLIWNLKTCCFFPSSPFGSETNSDFNFQIDFARVDLFHFTPLASWQQCRPNKWADFPLELFGNVNHWVIVANPNLGIDLEAFNICFEIALDCRKFLDQKSVASGVQ